MKNKIENENKKRKMNRDYCGLGVRSIQRIAKPLIVSMMMKFSISTENFMVCIVYRMSILQIEMIRIMTCVCVVPSSRL